MRRKDRYDTADLDENQFEPGSRRRVLKNLLGITSKREMDRMEGREQLRVLEELAGLYANDHRFTVADMCRIHRIWLGRIYPWAGKYRQVNVKKDSFPFAAAAQIPKLMTEFEDGPLKRHTPCRSVSTELISAALAEAHVELVLIHPFREGNAELRESWLCSWDCKRDCRRCILTNFQVEDDRNISPLCKPGWITITNRWRNYLPR